MKIFKFAHSEGAEIVAAKNAKDAIIFYFTSYQDDINTDEIIEFDGIKIEELQDDEINKKRKIFDEDKNSSEEISYNEIALEVFKDKPVILVTPNY